MRIHKKQRLIIAWVSFAILFCYLYAYPETTTTSILSPPHIPNILEDTFRQQDQDREQRQKEKVTCENCANGCSVETKIDCNYRTCNYKCTYDNVGEEHWKTTGMCTETLINCNNEEEVERPEGRIK